VLEAIVYLILVLFGVAIYFITAAHCSTVKTRLEKLILAINNNAPNPKADKFYSYFIGLRHAQILQIVVERAFGLFGIGGLVFVGISVREIATWHGTSKEFIEFLGNSFGWEAPVLLIGATVLFWIVWFEVRSFDAWLGDS